MKKQSDTIYHRGPRKQSDDIHLTPDVSYITNPDVAHEHTDVAVAPIAKFVVGLFIFGLIVLALVWGLFRYFDYREKAIEPQASPLARRGDERLPPEPRLQLAPGFGVRDENGKFVDLSITGAPPELKIPQAEYIETRKKWMQQLTTYGWADQGTGAVRIPIKDAKERFIQQQAAAQTNPAQTQSPQQTPQQQGGQANVETMPAASSSGQTTEKKNQ
ncbi:MAG TPA: hypothetical protein VF666_18950 [Pyrinomonadaceae bacterium]|jgi:hypothetical protein